MATRTRDRQLISIGGERKKEKKKKKRTNSYKQLGGLWSSASRQTRECFCLLACVCLAARARKSALEWVLSLVPPTPPPPCVHWRTFTWTLEGVLDLEVKGQGLRHSPLLPFIQALKLNESPPSTIGPLSDFFVEVLNLIPSFPSAHSFFLPS